MNEYIREKLESFKQDNDGSLDEKEDDIDEEYEEKLKKSRQRFSKSSGS